MQRRGEMLSISSRNTPYVTALSVLLMGSPLIVACGLQSKIIQQLSHLGIDKNARHTKAIEVNTIDADTYYNRGVAKGNWKIIKEQFLISLRW